MSDFMVVGPSVNDTEVADHRGTIVFIMCITPAYTVYIQYVW